MTETTLEFWWRLTAVLAAEATVISLVAFLAQHVVRSVAWRRTIWQACVVGVLMLLAIEFSGGSGVLTGWMKAPNSLSVRTTAQAPQFSLAISEGVEQPTMPAAPTLSGSESDTWWPGMLWLSGSALLIGRMLFVRVFFLLRAKRRRLDDPQLLARVHELSARLRIRRRVRIFEIPGLRGPIAFGIFRSSIGLPPDFAAFTQREQEAMLVHELAHLAARDPMWYSVVDLLAALMWWHPLVWWIRRRLHIATEAAADEASVLVEDGPSLLAEALVRLGGRMLERQRLGLLGVHGNGFRSDLGRRVERLMSMTQENWRPVSRSHSLVAKTAGPLFLAAVAICCCASMPSAHTAETKSLASRAFAALAASKAGPRPEYVAPQNVGPFSLSKAPASDPSTNTSVASPTLHTRTFRVDPVTFAKRLEEASTAQAQVGANLPLPESPSAGSIEKIGPAKSVQQLEALLELLAAAGVDIAPPKAVFWNDRLGMLMVRAPLEDLDTVEQIVQQLNAGPPQVTIEVKIADMPEASAKHLGLDWLGARVKSTLHRNQPSSPSVNTNAAEANLASVLTVDQSRAVFRAFEQRVGIDVLSTPRVTTLSSRQAQIKVVDIRSVATVTERAERTGFFDLVVTQHECGPSIDVIPVVRADGLTIDLTLIASFREFLGYDDTTQVVNVLNQDGSVGTAPKPLPRFRARQAVAHPTMVDGQTVAIGMGTFDEKQRVAFCTVTIIDPAGNRVRNQ